MNTMTYTTNKGVRLTILDIARSIQSTTKRICRKYLKWVGYYDDEASNPTMLP